MSSVLDAECPCSRRFDFYPFQLQAKLLCRYHARINSGEMKACPVYEMKACRRQMLVQAAHGAQKAVQTDTVDHFLFETEQLPSWEKCPLNKCPLSHTPDTTAYDVQIVGSKDVPQDAVQTDKSKCSGETEDLGAGTCNSSRNSGCNSSRKGQKEDLGAGGGEATAMKDRVNVIDVEDGYSADVEDGYSASATPSKRARFA